MPSARTKASGIVGTLKHLSDRDLFLVLAAIPILLLFLIAPQTFELSWAGFGQLGRGGLFFVLFFLGFDLLSFGKGDKIKWNRARKAVAVVAIVAASAYFVEVGLGQTLTDLIYSMGRVLGASGQVSNSFLMATDYAAYTIYLTLLAIILFGGSTIRRVITPIVFSLGMLFFYLLDAFFPYGTIGPLQFWANFIVAAVAALAGVVRLPIYGLSNNLTIVGLHGVFHLVVYWPSVGVQSTLIFSLVMVVIAAKIQAPLVRKAIYAIVGITGTVCLNVVRIFSISIYGYLYATSGQQLDAFHNVIGEIIFPIWIVVFLMIILTIEDRINPIPKQKLEKTRNLDTALKAEQQQPRKNRRAERNRGRVIRKKERSAA
jgi:thaumarchaeosortase